MANFRSFATATISGLAGGDPEVRTFGNTQIVSFPVPVSNGYKDKNGEWIDRTTWFNVKSMSEFLNKAILEHVHKGMVVTVVGRLSVNKYNNSDGREVTTVEILADNLSFGDRLETVTADTVPGTQTRDFTAHSPRISQPPATASLPFDDEPPF